MVWWKKKTYTATTNHILNYNATMTINGEF